MIDFELAANKALEIIFSKCTVKCCLFHYIQSLYRKLYVVVRANEPNSFTASNHTRTFWLLLVFFS